MSLLFQVFQVSLTGEKHKHRVQLKSCLLSTQMKKLKSQILQVDSKFFHHRDSISFPTGRYMSCHPNLILTRLTGPFSLGLGLPAWPRTKGEK